jgi:hypothetical protein
MTSPADPRDPRARDPQEGPDAATVSAVVAAVLGVALTVGALAIFGSRAALSVGAGATLAVTNLVAMSAIVRRVLQPAEEASAGASDEQDRSDAGSAAGGDADLEAELDARADAEIAGDATGTGRNGDPGVDHAAEGKRGGAAWGAFGLAKIVFLFGGIYLLLTRGMVDPMPLVVGYGVLPVGIAASSLFTSLAPPRRASRQPVRRSDRNPGPRRP